MGSVIVDSDFPYDLRHRGQRDANRHSKRIQKAIKKQLKDVISQEDIITSEGNKKIKVRLKYLDQYRFRHNPDRTDELGRDQFDDLEDGEIISRPNSGSNKYRPDIGDAEGEELYEVEYTIDELTDLMLKDLDLPDLDDTKRNEIVSETLEYTDRRKRTGIEGCLDKKQTILAHIKRKSQQCNGKDTIITQDDLRYKTWEITHEKHSNAVIFLMMDRSGSMWRNKIYTVKALYFWLVQFLRRRYDKVEIRFVAHDLKAKELAEKEFFSISDSGGTKVSSAYKMCRDIIKRDYPSSIWNIYCFHSSDGDSWEDEKECVELVGEILSLGANLFAYAEIDMDNYREGNSKLYSLLRKAAKSAKGYRKLLVASLSSMDDVYDTLKGFLKRHVGVSK